MRPFEDRIDQSGTVEETEILSIKVACQLVGNPLIRRHRLVFAIAHGRPDQIGEQFEADRAIATLVIADIDDETANPFLLQLGETIREKPLPVEYVARDGKTWECNNRVIAVDTKAPSRPNRACKKSGFLCCKRTGPEAEL